MGSRLKEDEKNEMIVRRLLKLTENKRCINCGGVGPQYVCMNFAIFVCTQCSGVHREFTHRIKSISMAKFTAAEVAALQAGGNERARDIFFREWDPQRNPPPDSSNPDKLRDFIKHVYVEKRYSGDRPPLKGRQVDREDCYESRRPDTLKDISADMRSPSYDDRADDLRYSDRSGPRRSDVDRGWFDKKLSPIRSKSGAGRRSYDERDRRTEERLANDFSRDRRFSFRDFDATPPPVHSVKDILGDNVPALHVELTDSNGCLQDDISSQSLGSRAEAPKDRRSQSFGSLGNGRAPVASSTHKRVSSGSLIDFSAESEPVTRTAAVDPLVGMGQATAAGSNSTGWATFDLAPAAPFPPDGYPAILAPNNGAVQWTGTGWGPSSTAGDTWSSFGAGPMQEQQNGASSSAMQASPGSARKRREIPQDFFVPAFPDASMPHMEMQQGAPLPGVRSVEPTLGESLGTFPSAGVMPAHTQPPRTRNPFDEESPMTTATFPGMGSLQAALPPAIHVTSAVPHWLHSLPQFPAPANPGGIGFGGQLSPGIMPSSLLPAEASGGFTTAPEYAAYSGSQFLSHTVMWPTGGNPFG